MPQRPAIGERPHQAGGLSQSPPFSFIVLIFIDFDRVSIFPHPVFQISFCSRSPLPAGGNQPVGYGEPYPAARMADGTLACEHSNYRPIRSWCRRIW
jgi:hypothetical protein